MINFQLVSTTGIKFDGEAYEVIIPSKAGPVSIFEDHMPLISAARPGVLSVRRRAGDPDSAMESFAINGGILATVGSIVRFMADDVTTPDEINEREAATAYDRAEELIKSAPNQTALQEAQRLLHHSSAKLQIAKVKKHHHHRPTPPSSITT